MSGKVINVRFNKSRNRKQRAQRMTRGSESEISTRMETMFGSSLDVLEEELELSNPKVAMWFAEQYLRRKGHRITQALRVKVKTTRDLEEASEMCTLAAANGEISFADCKEMQEALARHAVLSGLRTIDELKGELDEIRNRDKGAKHGLNGYTPVWGRLSEGKQQ